MRKILLVINVIIALAIFIFGGCAAAVFTTPAYPVGGVYTEISGPVTATGNTGYSKVGTAEFVSVFGILAFGDASIKTAMRNGEITQIHHIDYKMTNVLGIYAKYTVMVYGE
ncbi:MAG: TRL-like family protein [candidate division WOR-3 bacterium]